MTEHADSTNLHILAAVNEMNELLRRQGGGPPFLPLALSASNESKRLIVLRDQPLEGYTRVVVPRDGYGAEIDALAQNAPVLLLPGRAARIGGYVTSNADPASPVTLLLCNAEKAIDANNVPRIFVSSNKPWDMKFGDILWTGAIVAITAFATRPNVAVAEI